jgi:cbb3-type cytochrome oxidase subunit 3
VVAAVATEMFWLLFLIFLFGGTIVFLLNRNVPSKIGGIYSRPTIFFPLKFYLMKFIIARRQKKAKENQQNAVIKLFKLVFFR